MTLILLLIPALVLGYMAHRGGICMVRAVAEPMATGEGHMAVTFLKIAAWTLLLMAPALWWLPGAREIQVFSFHWLAPLGGFLFGMGAAVNGACAISTVTRLGNGEITKCATLVAMFAGAITVSLSQYHLGWPVDPAPLRSAMGTPDLLSLSVLVILTLWALREIYMRSRQRAWTRRDDVSGRWSLGLAALLIAVTNAVLCAFAENWTYTSWFAAIARNISAQGTDLELSLAEPLILVMLIVGAYLSGRHRRIFKIRRRGPGQWLSALAGGYLMGLGAFMAPGGNSALILHSGPLLSPHALPALVGMIFGIFAVLRVRLLLDKAPESMSCSGDVCRSDPLAP